MLEKFIPENEFEEGIQRAKLQLLPASDLLKKLVSMDVFISSVTEIQQDGSGFTPLLVGSNEQPLVSIFSSINRPTLHRERASYILKMPGDEFILRLPPNYGVIVNPGYESQLVIAPQTASQLAEELRARKRSSKDRDGG